MLSFPISFKILNESHLCAGTQDNYRLSAPMHQFLALTIPQALQSPYLWLHQPALLASPLCWPTAPMSWKYLPPPNPSGNSTPDTSRQRESLYLLLAYFESLCIFFLVNFLLSSYPIERISNAYPTFICVLVSTFERKRNDFATIRLGHVSNAPACLTCICSVRHLVSLCFILC